MSVSLDPGCAALLRYIYDRRRDRRFSFAPLLEQNVIDADELRVYLTALRDQDLIKPPAEQGTGAPAATTPPAHISPITATGVAWVETNFDDLRRRRR